MLSSTSICCADNKPASLLVTQAEGMPPVNSHKCALGCVPDRRNQVSGSIRQKYKDAELPNRHTVFSEQRVLLVFLALLATTGVVYAACIFC